MANEIFLTNNEKFHVFSKSPITPSMGLAQAVNKSGHTTTTADVWAEDIPWFFSADDKATALTTGKNAKLNDLVLIGSAVYKRNATEATEDATFDTLWESLTLSNGTKLYNSDNKHVLTYHKGVSVQFLTTSNNAKQASNYAGRIFINGKVVDQFVASTDKITDGVPSTGYGVAVYKSNSPLSEGEAEANFIANSYAGIIQFNTKVGPSTAYTADVFEYVGKKLDAEVARISAAVFGTGGDNPDQPTDLVTQVNLNTAAIATLNGAATEAGSVAKSVADAEARVKATTDALSGRIAQLEGIQHFSVVVCEGTTLPATPVENTIYLVAEPGVAEGTYIEYIAFKQGETVVTEKIGSTAIDLSGYTTDAEHEALTDRVTTAEGKVTTLEGQVATITSTDTTKEGSIAKALADAKSYAETKASEAKSGAEATAATKLSEALVQVGLDIESAKQNAIENAKVTLNQGTGIVVTPNGEASTEFTVSVSDAVATTESVTALTKTVGDNKTELEGKITEASNAASTALEGTKTEIKGVTDALDGRLGTAEGKITTLEGQVEVLTGTGENSVDAKIETAVSSTKTELQGEIDGVRQTANAAKTTADTAVQSASGDTYVSAKKETGTTNIKVTTNISAIDDELAEETSKVGAAIKAAKEAGVQAGADAQSAANAALSTAKSEIKTTTDGLDTRLTAAEGQITALTSGDNSVDKKIEAAEVRIKATTDALNETLTSTTATANSAAQSAEGDTYVGASQTGTKISVSTNIGAITTHVDSELVKTGTSVATAIDDAKKAGTDAASALNTAKEQSLAQNGSLDGMFTVATTGTVGTGITAITVSDAGLSQAIADAKAAGTTADSRSLASTSTGSSLVTVTTAGTVATGMTTTVNTSALGTAISDARTNAVADVKALLLNASDTDDTGKITVALSGTVETPSITVTTSDIASAQTLSDLVSTVNTHISEAAGLYLSVEKVDTLPADADAKTNKIYLVPVDTEAGRENNIHTEYIWTNGKWEIIGTTAIDINSLEAAAEAAQAAADKAQGEVDDLEGVVSALSQTVASNKSTTDTRLETLEAFIGGDDPSTGLSELLAKKVDDVTGGSNGVSISTTDTTDGRVATLSVSADTIVTENSTNVVTSGAVFSAIKTVSDLVGTTSVASQIDAKIATLEVTESTQNGITFSQTAGVASLSVEAVTAITESTSTSEDKLVTAGAVKAQLDSIASTHATDKEALENSIATKVGDVQWFGEHDILSSKAEVVDGKLVVSEQEVTCDDTFNASITKVVNNECYIGDEKYATVELDKMKTQLKMFYSSSLSEFSSDMPLLEDGQLMFGESSLTQFVGDLPSLTEAYSMFGVSQLEEFVGDLSSLMDGRCMFSDCHELTTFVGDLSSLTEGLTMFSHTNLSLESVECIADTINTHDGVITIHWHALPAEDKRQALVNELSRIVDKGWALSTNAELHALFDTEKYQIVENTIQPLDLDSEPQTVYYVVKK